MAQANVGHPKGLMVLFFTEMWERFSYYGMRAIFTLYMVKALVFDKEFASQIYGSYTGLVYLTPLLGGYMADRYWGNRKSIIVGGVLMAIGQFLLFVSGTMYENAGAAAPFFYGGLATLIFGNGFFKPNISTMVGQLYQPGDKRVDAAFTIFYMGINIGAFFSPLVCGTLGDTGNPADFKWGFLAACIGMLVGLATFVFLKDKYIVTPEGEAIGAAPNKSRQSDDAIAQGGGFTTSQVGTWAAVFAVLSFVLWYWGNLDVIGSFIFALCIAAPGLIITDTTLTRQEKERIAVIYIIAFFVIFFWAAFEQAGASLTFFAAEQTDRHLFGWEMPASYFQSVNPVAIVIFAPVFAWLWGYLGNRNMEPSSPLKQALGLFLLSVGYIVIAIGVKGIDPATKVSIFWLLSLYLIHTFGELCLSPIGLSMVVKLAPVKFASLLMGVWFLSTASANKFAGTLSALYPEAMISVNAIQKIETERTLKLLPDNFDPAKAPKVGGEVVISLENVRLSDIPEPTKTEVARQLGEAQVDNTKYFLGFGISNLYQFFMVFVVMSGLAAIILFLLSSRLLKMMHGVR